MGCPDTRKEAPGGTGMPPPKAALLVQAQRAKQHSTEPRSRTSALPSSANIRTRVSSRGSAQVPTLAGCDGGWMNQAGLK